jgi:hypothetical protein
MRNWTLIMMVVSGMALGAISAAPAWHASGELQNAASGNSVYLPMLQNGRSSHREAAPEGYRVNAPYFPDGVRLPETAVFWLGEITAQRNYADVRVGYTRDEFYLQAGIVDRYLWYDAAGRSKGFDQWDALSVYLSDGGKIYRFDAQLSWFEDRAKYQAAYLFENGAWTPVDIKFRTRTSWRGNAPNDEVGDRGWMVTYNLPFADLDLVGAAQHGAVWKMGVVLHDRDTKAGPAAVATRWPVSFDDQRTETWGQLGFGLPVYVPPAAVPGETVVIRQGLNGVKTPDSAAGGGTTCGKGLDYWTTWGEHTDYASEYFNVQNQYDIADWPCFARYYIRFPLDTVPQQKVILSARLVLHMFGSSGGGEWGDPPPSWIQVSRVEDGWQEKTLNWNNNPYALENYGGTWVEGLVKFPGWPGIRYEWDVTQAVAEAYAAGTPVNLGLYTSDGERHTGKYFSTSEVPDWNHKARPRLEILWGYP